jgi:hypothetical protein
MNYNKYFQNFIVIMMKSSFILEEFMLRVIKISINIEIKKKNNYLLLKLSKFLVFVNLKKKRRNYLTIFKVNGNIKSF